jgi:hypothetical protein
MYGKLNFREYSGLLRKLILSYSNPATCAALLKYPSTIFRKEGSAAWLAVSENL